MLDAYLFASNEVETDGVLALPTRSRYYALQPRERGTAQVESLSSYCARLAFLHHLPYGTLLARELRRFHRSTSKWQINSLYLNDATDTTQGWVTTLQESTIRTDLGLLTALPLAPILNPAQMLRKVPAWCPQCFEEQRQQGGPIYEHLLWSFALVHVCPQHQIRLLTICPICRLTFSLHTLEKLPGYCSACYAWLGSLEKEIEEHPTSQDEIQTARIIGDLLAFISARPLNLSLEIVASNLKAIIAAASNGTVTSTRGVSTAWGFRGETIKLLCHAQRKMTLRSYLNLIQQCGLKAMTLLDPTESAAVSVPVIHPLSARTTYILSPAHIGEMESALQQVLSSRFALTIETIAKMLHVSVGVLDSRFPQECSLLRERRKGAGSSTRKTAFHKTHDAVPIHKAETAQPTEMLSLLAQRQKRCSGGREKDYVREIEQRLQSVCFPPPHPAPSLTVVVKTLGCSRKVLWKYFPREARSIRERYEEEKVQIQQHQHEQKRNELWQAMRFLHQKGEYPNIPKIRTLTNGRLGQWMTPDLEAFYREKLRELDVLGKEA